MATAIREVSVKGTFESLRDFTALLEEKRQLHRIAVPVEKDWEVGAICRENFDLEGPAIWFEKVGSFHTPLLVGTLATRERYAMALGIEPTVEAIAAKWKHAYSHPIKPRVVSNSQASCKEVILDKVDLFSDPFPVPTWHPLDAGPELGALHGVVTMDPETGWINVGNYRNQILTKNQV